MVDSVDPYLTAPEEGDALVTGTDSEAMKKWNPNILGGKFRLSIIKSKDY